MAEGTLTVMRTKSNKKKKRKKRPKKKKPKAEKKNAGDGDPPDATDVDPEEVAELFNEAKREQKKLDSDKGIENFNTASGRKAWSGIIQRETHAAAQSVEPTDPAGPSTTAVSAIRSCHGEI